MLVFLLFEVGEEIPLVGQFCYEVDRRGIGEVPVELEDVRMIIASVQFDFSLNLLLKSLIT